MLKRLVIVAVLALCPTVGMTTVSVAAPTECPQFFPQGNAPDLANPKLLPKTREICYSAFAVLHSGITRTPLWAAEHLTRKGLDAAVATERKDTFHEEPRLPPDERADLDDYARSGFDHGHLAPAADMPDEQAQHESFSLANMIRLEHARMLKAVLDMVVQALETEENLLDKIAPTDTPDEVINPFQ